MAQDPYPGLGQITDPLLAQALRFVWDRIAVIALNTFGPRAGTLSPDERPALSSPDAGAVFYASDYNRRYRWTGTAWEDDPAAPTRFQIAFFLVAQAPQPGTGWVRCDGTSVRVSTSTGGTDYFQTPVIPAQNGQAAWIRL